MKQASQANENMSNFSQLSLDFALWSFRLWILYYVTK